MGNPGDSPDYTLAHLSNASWYRTTLPATAVTASDIALADVLALSPTDVWVVGTGGPGNDQSAVLLNGNGTTWLPVTIAGLPKAAPTG